MLTTPACEANTPYLLSPSRTQIQLSDEALEIVMLEVMGQNIHCKSGIVFHNESIAILQENEWCQFQTCLSTRPALSTRYVCRYMWQPQSH
jgi:hypothetical protein